jgi:hypothetical protein
MPALKPGKSKWLEWGLIVLAIWIYCLPFLDLGSLSNLPGPEAQYFQTFGQILEFSVKEQGQFPLWNPYYFTGIPYFAHPMLHVYNPLASLPVMIFGTLNGFKIAVFLGFIVAGLGMWWLGKELGLAPAGRIWVSLMYAFSGVAAAKFIQGQYVMVLGFGWIPFSLAAIIAATRGKRWMQICIAAIGLAFLFFCGNLYYAYYMLYVIALYTIISALRLERNPGKPRIDWKDLFRLGMTWFRSFGLLAVIGSGGLYVTDNLYFLYYIFFVAALFSFIRILRLEDCPLKLKISHEKIKVLVTIGILAFGLVAVQLVPVLEYRGQYIKDTNLGLTDSRNIQEVFLDFISPEPFRPGAYSNELRPEEFYAYVGWWPLVGMLFLPLAWNKQNKLNLSLLLSLVVFTFAWIDVKDMPWRSLFQTIPFLYQFRYPSRMVVIGAMALVAAGGLGLDKLGEIAWKLKNAESVNTRQRFIGNLLILALGIFLVWSVSDLAQTSRPLLKTSGIDETTTKAAEWLRHFDSGMYYVTAPNKWDRALVGNQIRYQNGGYAFNYLLSFKTQISDRKIVATPKYVILPNEFAPERGFVLLKSIGYINIYQTPDSLPFAFTMDTSILATDTGTNLTTKEVFPENFSATNINALEGFVSSDSNKVLILLSTFTPDWQLTIDDKPTKIYSAYGYMAAEVNPGTHHYRFIYKPVWFYVGLTITITTLVVIFILLIGELSDHFKIKRIRMASM